MEQWVLEASPPYWDELAQVVSVLLIVGMVVFVGRLLWEIRGALPKIVGIPLCLFAVITVGGAFLQYGTVTAAHLQEVAPEAAGITVLLALGVFFLLSVADLL